jgi:elongation factor Ts
MVEGGLRKFFEGTALMEQTYVIDNESQVKAVVEKAAKEIGAPVRIAGFVRMALGEGIERAKE